MREVYIGHDFEEIRKHGCFYIDKTSFIREWWEKRDSVTEIMRPEGFGKSLNLSMLLCFFSVEYTDRSDLFDGLNIWKDEKYRKLQGTYPVLYFSWENVTGNTFEEAQTSMIKEIEKLVHQHKDLLLQDDYYKDLSKPLRPSDVGHAIAMLSNCLEHHYKKKVLIFLDDCDKPQLEACIHGYQDEMSDYLDSIYTSMFKANCCMERAVLMGTTRVPQGNGFFTGFNNLVVRDLTTRFYPDSFGFTEREVSDALKEYNLSHEINQVKKWYGNFICEGVSLYHPSSIAAFLKSNGTYDTYCYDLHGIISHEILLMDDYEKNEMEDILNHKSIHKVINGEIKITDIDYGSEDFWSLLLACGFLRIDSIEFNESEYVYTLSLVNEEAEETIHDAIRRWFEKTGDAVSEFIKGLIHSDLSAIQSNLQIVFMKAESFYTHKGRMSEDDQIMTICHSLILTMIVQEKNYTITSDKDRTFDEYDILMMPKEKKLPGIIIEFKAFNPKHEKTLEETADRALKQIQDKNYDAELLSNDVKNIIHYGMGFSGKTAVVHKE